MKIVIVEDDTFLAQMYASKLKLEGYSVLTAGDGEKGVAMITRERPDLVLLDIVLPKMDGFAVLEAVRKNPETRNIPVLLLTNLSQKKDIERGLALGANDYLTKSHFVPTEVAEKIRRFIGGNDTDSAEAA